jgi:hypothetical protein
MTIIDFSISLLFLSALVGMSTGSKAAEGSMLDDKVRRKITDAATGQAGWKPEEVRVSEVEWLRRPSCSFYTASNKVIPLSYQLNFALLGDGNVLGAGEGRSVARILDTCGSDASADWWAEVVTRFHRDIGGGAVLRDEHTRSWVTRKLAKLNETFTSPSLSRDHRSLSYLLLNPETSAVYRVEAQRNQSGEIEVKSTQVLPGT